MVRTQIQLTEQQASELKKRATREGRSMADLIRLSVDAYLARGEDESRQAKYKRALTVIGKYDSGKRDISTRHDDYLAEAYRG
jgi:hypothetical protein